MSTSNPFAPGTASAEADPDAPPSAGPWLVLAAVAMALSGLFAFTYGLQLLVFIRFSGYGDLASFSWMLFGGAQIVLAGFVSQGRGWAALAATAVCALQVPLSLGWNIYVLLIPLISPLGLLWLLTTLPAAALAPLAIGPAMRATAYWKRLSE